MKLNKKLKITGIIIIISLLAFGVCAYLLRSLITGETVRQFILPIAEDYIGRKIEFEDIKISVFSGIVVKNVSVSERSGYGEGKFISCDEVDIRYNFLKLLQRELVLQSIYVKSPQINVVRDASGSFNFSDINEHIKKQDEKKDKKETGVKKIKSGDNGKEITISIRKVVVQDGSIKFTDSKTNPDGSLWYELKKINMTLKGKAVDSPIDILLNAGLTSSGDSGKESEVSVKGDINTSTGSVNIDAELKDIKLASFREYLFSDLSTPAIETGNISFDIPLKILSDDYRKEAKFECTPKIKTSSGDLNLSLSGIIENIKESPSYKAKISFKKLLLSSLVSFLPEAKRKSLNAIEIRGGEVDGSLDLEGSFSEERKTVVRGGVAFSGVKGILKDYNSLPVELAGNALIGAEKIDFNINQLKIPESSLSLKGTVNLEPAEVISYNVKVSIEKLSLPSLMPFLPQDTIKSLNGIQVETGSVSGNLDLGGSFSGNKKVVVKGNVVLKEFKGLLKDYNSMPVEIDGNALIGKEEITFNLEPLKVPGSSFSVKGIVNSKPAGGEDVSLDVTTKHLDADALINAMGSEKTEKNKSGKKKEGQAKENKKANSQPGQSLNIKARFAAGEVKYNNVMISEMNSEIQYFEDNLLIDKLQFGFGEGRVDIKGKINFSEDDPVFDGKTDIQKAGLAEIVQILSPDFKGTINGKVSGNAVIAGKGSKWEKIKDELKGKGSITAENISLSNIKIMDQVASFLGVDELKKVEFRDGNMNFVIEGGKVKYDDCNLRGDTVKVKSDGKIAFDKSLNCDIEISLSPELSAKVIRKHEFSSLFQDDKGWITVPITLKGTTDSPRPGLSSKAVNKKVIEKGTDMLNNELQKLLNKDSSKKKQGKDKGNLLDNLFKQLK